MAKTRGTWQTAIAVSPAAALAPHKSKAEKARARELVGRFGRLTVPVAALSAAQRSIVAIARALNSWRHSRNLLVLDEPTETLHASEVETLFSAVRRLADRLPHGRRRPGLPGRDPAHRPHQRRASA